MNTHPSKYLILFTLMVSTGLAHALTAGGTNWTQQLGTTGDDYASSVAVDSNGNTYVTGRTYGDLDGNINAGDADLFLTKYNSAGVQQWTQQLGTTTYDTASGVAVNIASGFVYVTGTTNGDLGGNTSAGGADLFLVQYNIDGVKQWTEQLGTAEDDEARGMALDYSGNVYITGSTYGVLGASEAGDLFDNDLFLVKFNSDGIKFWTQQLGTPALNDEGNSLAVDNNNNVYVTGHTYGDLDGNTLAGFVDLFLVKYDTDGNKQWTQQLGVPNASISTYAYGVAMDSNDNAYVTGTTNGTLEGSIDTYAGGSDLFLVKYDSVGEKKWVRQMGTTGPEASNGIAIDFDDNIYITGYTGGALDGNTSAGSNDIFLAKYDSTGFGFDYGYKHWTRQLGTTTVENGSSVAVDNSGNAFVTGDTDGGLEGNTNAGGYDVILSQFDVREPVGTISINSSDSFTDTTSVALTLTCDDGIGSGCTQMRISEDDVNWSAWETINSPRLWTVSSGDGEKIVYVQYTDTAGNISSSYSETIDLITSGGDSGSTGSSGGGCSLNRGGNIDPLLPLLMLVSAVYLLRRRRAD